MEKRKNGFQAATPKGAKNTGSDVWLTPQWIINNIGISDLDPCGWLPNDAPIVKTAKSYYTEEDDGLNRTWAGSVFCNPPYSDLKTWLEKCDEYHSRSGEDVIVLCFVRSDTKALQQNLKNCTGINLMNKRVKFLNSEGLEQSNGNAPSCLIAWGESAYQRIKNVDGLCFRKD